MVAAFDHSDVEKWMFITCTGTSEGRYPKDAEGDNIGLAIENDFIALTGLAVDESDAQHMLLCGWICEKKYHIWGRNKFFGAGSAGTPGGNAAFIPPFTFTKEQFDNLVAAIRGGDDDGDNASMDMVDAEDNDDGFPSF